MCTQVMGENHSNKILYVAILNVTYVICMHSL